MTAKQKATKGLLDLLFTVKPRSEFESEEEVTKLEDLAYDLVGDLMDAVYEEYDVTPKRF